MASEVVGGHKQATWILEAGLQKILAATFKKWGESMLGRSDSKSRQAAEKGGMSSMGRAGRIRRAGKLSKNGACPRWAGQVGKRELVLEGQGRSDSKRRQACENPRGRH